MVECLDKKRPIMVVITLKDMMCYKLSYLLRHSYCVAIHVPATPIHVPDYSGRGSGCIPDPRHVAGYRVMKIIQPEIRPSFRGSGFTMEGLGEIVFEFFYLRGINGSQQDIYVVIGPIDLKSNNSQLQRIITEGPLHTMKTEMIQQDNVDILNGADLIPNWSWFSWGQ